jgi:hypothetical protein
VYTVTLSQKIKLQKGSYVFNYKLNAGLPTFDSFNVKIFYGNNINNTYYNYSPTSGNGPNSLNYGDWRLFEGKFKVNNNNTTITLQFTSTGVLSYIYLTRVSLKTQA